MQLEARKYLLDIERAADLLSKFVAAKTLVDYVNDPLLQSAVERQFEIIGEAATKLAKADTVTAARITDYRKMIAFRNILIHGYAEVDDPLVWDIVQTRLPLLQREIKALCAAAANN